MAGSPVLIVDGHSVIYAWEKLREQHHRKPAEARLQLERELLAFQDSSDWKVVLVFDGQGIRTQNQAGETELQVFYSKSGQTADSVIERLVAKYAESREITVATADRLEQQTVVSFGGYFWTPEELQVEIKRAADRLRAFLKARKKNLGHGRL
ncbi:MAG: NYN domain-containing protein [Verrucomicrobiales bacterium]